LARPNAPTATGLIPTSGEDLHQLNVPIAAEIEMVDADIAVVFMPLRDAWGRMVWRRESGWSV
jgi:hypothetical protein